MIRSRHNTYVSVTDWFKNKSESASSQQLKPAIVQYLNNIGGENIVLPPTTDSPIIVPPSSGGGTTETNCLWELKQDSYGNSYIYGNLPVVTQYGITMYADVSNIDLPSLYDGLPIDNSTIYWEETLDDTGNIIKVLKAKGGGGIDIDGTLDDYLFDYLTDNNYAQKSDLPNMSLYVTNDIFNSTIDSLDFVDFNTYETINAIKNFKEGIEINEIDIYNIKDDIIYINGNVAIKGGLTTYADAGDIDLPSLYAGIPVDETTITKREDGALMLNPNLEFGGLDETALQKYLDDYNYAKITDIDSRINDLVNGAPAAYDTLKEIADVLQGNVNSIGDIITALGTKVDKTELTKYIPIAGDTEVDGIKNFLNGLKIGGLPISKYEGYDDVIYLDANLVVRGGVTVYADNEADIPSIIDSLPIASNTIKGIASFNSDYFTIDNGHVSIKNSIDLGGGNKVFVTTPTLVDDYDIGDLWVNATSGRYKNDLLRCNKAKSAGEVFNIDHWSLATKYTDDSKALEVESNVSSLSQNFNVLNSTVESIKQQTDKEYVIWFFEYVPTLNNYPASDWTTPELKAEHDQDLFYYREQGKAWRFEDGKWVEVTDHDTIRALELIEEIKGDYVSLSIAQDIPSEKNFVGGLKVNGSPIIYDTELSQWKLENNLLVTGGITTYSDIRKKTKLEEVSLSLNQIADAPLIKHYYNNDITKTIHVSTIAQYWMDINDWFCKFDSDGYYTMEIQNLALASAISIARELVKSNKIIAELMDRINVLESKLKNS